MRLSKKKLQVRIFLTFYLHSCTVVSIIVDTEFAADLLNLGVNALLS